MNIGMVLFIIYDITFMIFFNQWRFNAVPSTTILIQDILSSVWVRLSVSFLFGVLYLIHRNLNSENFNYVFPLLTFLVYVSLYMTNFFPYSLNWTNFEIIYFVVVHNPISMILKSSLNILPIYNLWLESLGELWSLGNNIFYFIFSLFYFLNWFL